MNALLRSGSAPSSGSSCVGASESGAPRAPAADELGRQQFLVGGAGGALAHVLAEGGHARVQLAHDHKGAVATQHLGLRDGQRVAGLVLVAEHELADLERRLVRVGTDDAAALDRRLADAILEAERLALVGQRVDILAPEQLDAGQLAQGCASALNQRLEALGVGREGQQHDVNVGGAERRLPVLGRVLADVAEIGGTSGHALLELGREAGQRLLGHTQRLEAVEREAEGQPSLLGGVGRVGGRGQGRRDPAQQLAAGAAVVDPQQEVGAGVGRGPRPQRAGLDIIKIGRNNRFDGHDYLPFKVGRAAGLPLPLYFLLTVAAPPLQ